MFFNESKENVLGGGEGAVNGLRDIFIIYKDDWVGKK